MSNTAPESFIKLSSILTGFTEATLTLALQTADYYSEFEKRQTSPSLSNLLALYDRLSSSGKTPDEIGAAIMDETASGGLNTLAQALMIFWYTGQIQDMNQIVVPPEQRDWVIPNGNLYAQSLSWRAIQAHASGVSNQKFGYWASKPADLSDYL